jgi:undecaprenyl-diphosphatase
VQNTFSLDVPVVFDIFLHLGTLAAVCVVYRKDIIAMLQALLRLDFKSKEFQLILFIILAMIPTAIIGFTFKSFFESMFKSNLQIGIALIITGIILYLASTIASRIKSTGKPLSAISAFIIGIFQGIAVAPGISRSGTTISAGLLQGISAKEAAKFSFLLSIPAVLGAAAFEVKDMAKSSVSIDWIPFLLGAVIAAIIGYFAIKFLLKLLEEKKFQWFAYYCWIIGIIVIIVIIFSSIKI